MPTTSTHDNSLLKLEERITELETQVKQLNCSHTDIEFTWDPPSGTYRTKVQKCKSCAKLLEYYNSYSSKGDLQALKDESKYLKAKAKALDAQVKAYETPKT